MPSSFLYIDTNFPTFTGEESTNKKITTIQNYLFMLVEQLRYSLRNLDLTNMNQTAVEKFTNYLTEPIYGRIDDDEGNITQLQLTAQGLAAQISNANGDISRLQMTASSLQTQISNAAGDISAVKQTAASLQTQISNINGDVSSLKQTATSLTSQIATANGNISQLQQTANSLSSQIATANGEISSIRQTANSISSTVANQQGQINTITQSMNGVVYASSLANGTTTINGGCITTGTINASYVGVNGAFVMRLGNTAYGYMGATTIGSYAGTAIFSTNYSNYVIVTTGGARMTSGQHSIFVSAGCYSTSAMQVWSDRRKKDDIRYDMERYEELFLRMKPCHYELKADGGSGKRHIGVIANEVQEAMREIGMKEQDLAMLGRDGDTLSFSYGELTALNAHMIQKLYFEMKKLRCRVEELEETA